MKSNVVIALCAAILWMGGCGKQTASNPNPVPELPPEQLVPTLKEIAETGKYIQVSMSLTAGLEKAGYMSEAAMVQNFQYAESPEKVKEMAAEIVQRLQEQTPIDNNSL